MKNISGFRVQGTGYRKDKNSLLNLSVIARAKPVSLRAFFAKPAALPLGRQSRFFLSIFFLSTVYYLLPTFLFAADTVIKGTTEDSTAASLEVTNSGDSSLLYVRNDGNVGIGTTAPGAGNKLDVVGNGNFGGDAAGVTRSLTVDNTDLTNVNSHSKLAILTNSGNGGDPHILFSNRVVNWVAGLDNSDSDKFKISSSNSLGTDDRITIQLDGNVGIGTTIPTAMLHIVRSVGSSGALKLEGNDVTTGLPLINFINNNGGLNGNLGWSDSGFSFTSGNVGIGTASPVSALTIGDVSSNAGEISSNAIRTGSGGRYGMGFNTSAGGFYNIFAHQGAQQIGIGFDTGSYGTFNSFVTVKGDGNVGIGTTSPGLPLDIESATYALPATSGTAQTGKLRLKPTVSTVVLDMGVWGSSPYGGWLQSTDSDNLSLKYPLLLNPNGGNVGIGTASPSLRLHIHGAGTGPAASGTAQIGIARFSQSGGTAVLDVGAGSGGGNSWIQSTNSSDLSISYPLFLNPNGGNVGIGTTAPTDPLQVQTNSSGHTIGLIGRASDNWSTITFLNNAKTSEFLIQSQGNNLAITGGNVGIGTTAPGAKLEVKGAYPQIKLDNPTAGAGSLIDFADGRTLKQRIGHITTTQALQVADGSNNVLLHVENTGNVGIGTTAPGYKFVSQTSATGTGTLTAAAAFRDSSSNGNELLIRTGTGEINLLATWETSGIATDLSFTPTTAAGVQTEAMRIKSTGSVGIGTTNPTLGPLQMGSGAYVTSGGVWTNASSRTYKQDIAPLDLGNAMKVFNGLQPVTFKYKKAVDEQHVGFIAEDVPDLVATKDRTGLSAMDIVAVLTKVVQGQQKEIEELKRCIRGR